MNVHHQGHHNNNVSITSTNPACLLVATESKLFQPQAEDILTDEDLLDLFRIVKQVLRKKPDSDKLAKLLFCVSYALGDHVKFFKPLHEDKIIFRDDINGLTNTTIVNAVRLPNNSSCCINSQEERLSTTSTTATFRTTTTTTTKENNNTSNQDQIHKWQDMTTSSSSPSSVSSVLSSQSPLTRLLGVSHLTNQQQNNNPSSSSSSSSPPSVLPTSTTTNNTSISSPITSTINPTTITNSQQQQQQQQQPISSTIASDVSIHSEETTTDPYTVRPYTNFRPIYTSTSSPAIPTHTSFERTDNNTRYPQDTIVSSPNSNTSSTNNNNNNHVASPIAAITDLYLPHHTHNPPTSLPDHGLKPQSEIVMEPKQRGFYYQDGRITREPVLLQRYAEQGILTQASLMRKRKRHSTDTNIPFEGNQPPAPTKKPKIPHRHGEFEQRRDDIINRMRTITMQDLEQKAQRMPVDFALVIEETQLPENLPTNLTKEQAGDYLEPALRILTSHSNMKPHLDNGMNQNGIYYNSDYFRLYMAFEQFQKTFATLFPHEVVIIPEDDLDGTMITTSSSPSLNNNNNNNNNNTNSNGIGGSGVERDRDRERNANMKAYRSWIEPLLTDTNWAAFRRNIVVGERMMQLTKVVGQGVLLMTKELSGSKLHLTFTNNEWDEFITGLSSGRWDQTIKWDTTNDQQQQQQQQQQHLNKSRLVLELRQKFLTSYWFNPNGTVVTPKDRKLLYRTITSSTSSTSSSSSSSSSSSANNTNYNTATNLPSPNHLMDHSHHHQLHHQHHHQSNDNDTNSKMALHNTSDPPFQNNEISLLADIIQ
ncbi:unnamed protein product [Cunninghamella echinulata]